MRPRSGVGWFRRHPAIQIMPLNRRGRGNGGSKRNRNAMCIFPTEASRGDKEQSSLRLDALKGSIELDGSTDEIVNLAQSLLAAHAVPEDEVTDAYHIATAAIHEMDVLLTWNCRHMANRFTLPKTVAVVTKAGYRCPAIVTPENYLKEDLDE